MVKILVTGATSFIGRHFVKALAGCEIYSIERLPLKYDLPPQRVRFEHDLRSEVPAWIVQAVQGADCLVHLAADVSGAKSLQDPELSVATNVVGTFHVLELARKLPNLKRFVQVSTGEVVGAVPFPFFADEKTPLRPSNPYSASKAAAEALVNAYRVSFGVPAITIRSMNVFGPGQSLDRFVPMVIDRLKKGQKIPCHAGPDGTVGSRCWLHVDRFVGALTRALDPRHDYQVGETYHVVGPELNNQDVVEILSGALKSGSHIEKVVPGPSHDLRYALRDTKLGYRFSEGDLERDLAHTAVAS